MGDCGAKVKDSLAGSARRILLLAQLPNSIWRYPPLWMSIDKNLGPLFPCMMVSGVSFPERYDEPLASRLSPRHRIIRCSPARSLTVTSSYILEQPALFTMAPHLSIATLFSHFRLTTCRHDGIAHHSRFFDFLGSSTSSTSAENATGPHLACMPGGEPANHCIEWHRRCDL